MTRRLDITVMLGQVYGRLTAVSFAGVSDGKQMVRCLCVCGAQKTTRASYLRKGKVQSCGCLKLEPRNRSSPVRLKAVRRGSGSGIHRRSGRPEYISWKAARGRCNNPRDKNYRYYGGRGIRMCERWNSFANFLADMGPRPPGTSIERLDNNKGYEPGNCVWATMLEQGRNHRNTRRFSHNGESLTLAQWSERSGIPVKRLTRRTERGIPIALAMSVPVARGAAFQRALMATAAAHLLALGRAQRMALLVRPLVIRARFAKESARVLAELTEQDRQLVKSLVSDQRALLLAGAAS